MPEAEQYCVGVFIVVKVPGVEPRLDTAHLVSLACRRALGAEWGLRPKMVRWLYIRLVACHHESHCQKSS